MTWFLVGVLTGVFFMSLISVGKQADERMHDVAKGKDR